MGTEVVLAQSFELDDEWFATLAQMSPTFCYVWADDISWDETHRMIVVELNDEGLAERTTQTGNRTLRFEPPIIGRAAARTLDEVRADLREHLDLAIREGDAGEIDAELADCVLQMLVYGKLIFG